MWYVNKLYAGSWGPHEITCIWMFVLATFPPVYNVQATTQPLQPARFRSRRRRRTPRPLRRHRRKASPPRRCPLAACGGNENEGVLIKQSPCLQVGSTKRTLSGHPWMTSASAQGGWLKSIGITGLKGSSQVVWNWMNKLCFVYLLQAGERNFSPYIHTT